MTRELQVLHLVDRVDDGGAANVAVTLNRALRQMGVYSVIATLGAATPLDSGEIIAKGGWACGVARRIWARLDKRVLLSEGVGGAIQFSRLPGFMPVAWLVPKRDFDIVHCHNAVPSILRWPVAMGRRLVWTFHDYWGVTGGCRVPGVCQGYRTDCGVCVYAANNRRSERRVLARRWKADSLWPRVNAFVAPSSAVAANVATIPQFPSERLFVVPNPLRSMNVAARHSDPADDITATGECEKTLLFGANYIDTPNKGAGFLHEIMRRLRLRGRWSLCVFGRHSTPVENFLPPGTRYLGWTSNNATLAAWYAMASVFVSLSRDETFGLTLAEAMACGTPVAAWDAGGTRDVIEPGEAAAIVRYGNCEELVSAIERVAVASAKIRGKQADATRRRLSPTVVGQQYLKIYENALR